MAFVNSWVDGRILYRMMGGLVHGVTGDGRCLLATRFCQLVFIPTAEGFVASDMCIVSDDCAEPTL